MDNSLEQTQKQPQTESFPSVDHLRETMASNRRFRVHIFIAGIISLIVSIINMITQMAGASYPWFAFVYGAFCISISFHYFVFNRPTKELLNLHFSWFATVVGINTVIWIWAETPYCWPLNIVFGWGMLLGAHWAAVFFRESPHRALSIHLTIFTNLQLLLLVIFLNSGSSFPWFLVAFLGCAIFPLIHWTLHYYPGNKFRIHLVLFSDIQLLCFTTWLSTKGFPWPYILLFVWGALLALHYFINKRKNAYIDVQATTGSSFAIPVPSDHQPPQYTYQPPVMQPTNSQQGAVQPVPLIYPEGYRPPQMYPSVSSPFPPAYQAYYPDPQNKV